MSGTVTKILSSTFSVAVVTGEDPGPPIEPIWTDIHGINQLTHAPTTNRADVHDFDSAGRQEHIVTRRGDTFTVNAYRLDNEATGERDPGQAFMEAQSKVVGPSAETRVQILAPGGSGVAFTCTVQTTNFGGSTDDPAGWSCEMVVTGDITDIAAPE
jgi:hypothetical protein